MCGIIGIFNFFGQEPIDKQLAVKMIKAVSHRGPDDTGSFFCDKAGVFLGHRRLSIIDLITGHQPMCNEDGSVWISFDGKIYNYADLRDELISFGHTFRTQSDTETIIHAYEQWGTEVFTHLNGIYAFALYNKTDFTLILARDPFGIKPLYYWEDGTSVIFGSELKSILFHPKVNREIDLHALYGFLSWTYTPSPKTLFSGIKKLPPGHVLMFTPDGGKIKRFYRKPPRLLLNTPKEDLIRDLYLNIDTAINRQMIGDVPIGVMLSGGLDSSTIATIMTETNGGAVKSFSVGIVGDDRLNELDYARKVAQQLDCEHYDIVMSPDDFIDLLPISISHLEEPIATAATLPFFMICQFASQYVKVVLTGQGADESFGGYQRHLGERYGHLYRAIPRFLRRNLIDPAVRCLPRNEMLKRAVSSLGINDPVRRMVEIYHTMDPNLRQNLFHRDVLEAGDNYLKNVVQYWQSDVTHLDGLSQMLYIDSRLSLADNILMFSDKIAMATSLEARVPYLDSELMQFVESIPPNLKIKAATQKYILKKAVSKLIPYDIIHRQKIGLTLPMGTWFKTKLRNLIRDKLLAPGSACSAFLNIGTIRTMLDDHQNNRLDYKRALFSLLTFETWYELFIKPSHWD